LSAFLKSSTLRFFFKASRSPNPMELDQIQIAPHTGRNNASAESWLRGVVCGCGTPRVVAAAHSSVSSRTRYDELKLVAINRRFIGGQ
jgi:hypothetical protein